MDRETFYTIRRGYRSLLKRDNQWRADPFADRRGMYDRAPNEAQRFLSSLSPRVQRCLTGYPSHPTLRQEQIERCKRTPKHERSKDAAIAHGIAQSKSGWLRMNQDMPSLTEGTCRLCQQGSPCWFHKVAA